MNGQTLGLPVSGAKKAIPRLGQCQEVNYTTVATAPIAPEETRRRARDQAELWHKELLPESAIIVRP